MKFGLITILKSSLLATMILLAMTSFAQDAQQPKQSQTEQSTEQAAVKQAAEKTQKININTADAQTLTKLPRIGLKIAERIVAHRAEHGQFNKLEELLNVSGIGEKTYERLAALITL